MQLIQRPILLLLFLVSVWIIVFWPTLVEMERVWRGSDTYMHCYVVPLIAAWLAWQQKKMPKLGCSWLFLFFAIVTSFLWVVGFAGDINTISQFCAVMALQASFLAVMDRQSRRSYLFPVFFLIFLVPFGDEFNPLLQDITATMTVDILRIIGVPVFREGLFLTTPIGHFEVAEACSGLRFLVASFVIGALYAHLTYKSLFRQMIFLVSLLIASIIANGLRAALLIWMAEISNYKLGFGEDHYLYGWIVFGLTMFMMFWLGGFFAQSTAVDLKVSSTATGTPTSNVNYLQPSIALVVLIALFGTIKILQQQIHSVEVPAAPHTISTPPEFSLTLESTLDSTFNDGINRLQMMTTDGVEVLYARYAAKQTKGELVNWNNVLFNRKTWMVLEDTELQTAQGPVRKLLVSNMAGQQRQIISWYQVDGRRITSPIQVKFWQLVALLTAQPGRSTITILSRTTTAGPINIQSAITISDTIQTLDSDNNITIR